MTTLFSEQAISGALERLAPQIVEDLGTHFIMVPILTGGFIFGADLARALHKAGADPEIDFLQLSSYGKGRESLGEVKLLKDMTTPVQNQTVLLVDDVLDSGRSLFHATMLLRERGVKKVAVCVAVDKRQDRLNSVVADYTLFETDGEAFLVGYGMDDAGLSRGLPYIGKVE